MKPSGSGRTLTCTGHVKLWREDLALSCERLVAVFGADSTLKTAHCTGAVRIVSPQGVAQAGDAQFDGKQNTVALTGKPRANQKGFVVQGQVIRMDLTTGEISVDNPVGTVAPDGLPAGRAP